MSRRIDERDIIGQQFGELTVLDTAGKTKGGEWKYHCRCSCGNEKDVVRSCLLHGQTKSCGHLSKKDPKELIGRQIGELLVIEQTDEVERGEKLFRCKCSCGNECFFRGSELRSGKRISCGHIRKEAPEKLIGQQFGELTVISLAERADDGEIQYLCKCSCGEETVVRRHALRNGVTKSCGHIKLCDHSDMIGQKFGELTVMEYAGKNDYGEIQYKCRCSCGKEIIAGRNSLKTGWVKSCGHLRYSSFDPQSEVGKQYGKWTVVEFVEHVDNRWMFRVRCECGNESIVPIQSLTRGLSKSCGHCVEPWIENMGDYFKYHTAVDKTFLFSPEDLELVEQHKWTLNHDGYAVTTDEESVRLTRLMFDAGEDEYIDHINMDVTDNRRENLRLATWSDNNCNKVLQNNNTTGLKGVSYHKGAKKYVAVLWKDGVRYYGGLHETKEAAGHAYDGLARELHGEFARLNFPEEGEQSCRKAG